MQGVNRVADNSRPNMAAFLYGNPAIQFWNACSVGKLDLPILRRHFGGSDIMPNFQPPVGRLEFSNSLVSIPAVRTKNFYANDESVLQKMEELGYVTLLQVR